MIISEMQRKLATWAATDPSLRIQRLLRLITQPEWLAEAARITLSSKGAHTPGVDGVNKTMLQARLAVELQILRDELLSGHYQPLPARRVYIPKSNVLMIATMATQRGYQMGRWLAGRLMKELGLVSCQQPTHRYKRGGHEHVAIPNHLERQFAVTEPNQVWCGDVTYSVPGVQGGHGCLNEPRVCLEY